jgi:hypothetical protein
MKEPDGSQRVEYDAFFSLDGDAKTLRELLNKAARFRWELHSATPVVGKGGKVEAVLCVMQRLTVSEIWAEARSREIEEKREREGER